MARIALPRLRALCRAAPCLPPPLPGRRHLHAKR